MLAGLLSMGLAAVVHLVTLPTEFAAVDDRDGPHEGRRLIRGRRRLGLTPGKTPPTTACA